MKTLKFLPLLVVTGFLVFAMVYSVDWNPRTIMQIQTKSLDSLVLGKDKSDFNGDTVEIIGRVVAPPQVNTPWGLKSLLRGTSSWTCYIQDTNNNLWGGIVVRQATRFTNTFIQNVDTGNIVKLRGKVQEFFSTGTPGTSGFLTQIELDTTSGPIQILSLQGKRPTPKLVTVADFANGDYPNGGTINYVDGEKYEGMYVEFRNVETSTGLASRQPFSIVDANGNKIYIRDYSNFYSASPSPSSDTLAKLWGWTTPTPGTVVNYIRGVIINANNEGVFGNQLPYALVPLYPNDISLGAAAPVLSNPQKLPGVPTPSDSVTVSVAVTSQTALTNVSVLFRVNGGAFNTKNMNLSTGTIYVTKLPPAPVNTLVEYFIKATNTGGLTKLLPADTLKSKLFYVVKNSDSLSIQEVQYCPNNGGFSGYQGAFVRGIEGIVTADTSDIRNFSYTGPGGTQSSPQRVIIQNGQGPYSGIWISGVPTDVILKGQRVRVRGIVESYFGINRISVATPTDVTILSSGNPLPSPQILTTAELGNAKLGGDSTIKKWESVLVRLNSPVSITCINANRGTACISGEPLPDTAFRRNYGEILVRDFSGIEARITLQGGNHTFTNNWDGVTAGKTLLTKNDSISFVEGILYYSFSNYKITPRRNTDFGNVVPIGITNLSEIVNSYDLSQNYPNPFNPVTKIKYAIPVNACVSVKIYDILGREVAVLVNQSMNAGSYLIDFNASEFASGVYFYRLNAQGRDGSTFNMVKKMVLVK